MDLIYTIYGHMTLMLNELVDALPKVVSFVWVLKLRPTGGNVDRVGWDNLTDSSTVTVLRDQT